ncbi:MAG: hypothetical protein DRI48_02540 [Chloroflexi bacterium]|nr:MAG: hypothetical protein DRI48_02540 [Chloroflexota bacterium]
MILSSGETCAVEAYFGLEGEITPRRFTWHGRMLSVEGVGRQWQEDGERCFVVLAAGGRPFELRLDEDALLWRVCCLSTSGMAA